ncbi:MAG: PilC/PilY family type IV pilus protein, partial [Betaproteobacteria bacterium]
LTRRHLDPYTAAVSPTIDWAVQAKLDAKDPSTRSIYTFDSSVAVTKLKEFTSANFATNANFLTPNISTSPNGLSQFLCSSVDVCLSATNQGTAYAAGANLVNYLRGDRTNEGSETDNTKYYRQRAHVLGDMVNAQAVYISVPNHSYADAGYGQFVAALTTTPRQATVYAGANDGMLHAFAAKGSTTTEAAVTAAGRASSAYALDPSNASLASLAASTAADAATALAADTVVGQELWAYIPAPVMPTLYKLADKRYKDMHRYYVDATPAVGDICTADCTPAANATAVIAVWKTILVGGLGRGGRGYYALDVTNPNSPKALWEFTNDNLGYTYGNPQIAKMNDGTWVVLVASGYNNIPNDAGAAGDGVGRLFVLNAATGALIRSISTGVGSTTDPSGLAKITAQVVNPTSDATVEAVYGGDMLGNLWRFDINNNVGATGYDAQLLATLKDGSGNVQPITTRPQVGLEPKNSVKVVFVGTGRFLDPFDVTDVSQQSLYAIKDVRGTGTTPAVAVFDNPGDAPRAGAGVTSSQGFVRQIQSAITCPVGNLPSVCAQGETIITSTNYPVDFVSDNGWVVDLIHNAERNNTDPGLDRSTVVFHTNAPSLAACDIGGNGYGYFLNYLTGGPNYSPGNGLAALNNGLVGKWFGNTFVSAPTLVITGDGRMIDIFSKSDGTIGGYVPPKSLDTGRARRTSWRELIRE